jgi:hypothetical protein
MKTPSSPKVPTAELDALKGAAADMERFVEEKLLDEAGLLRSFLNKDTLRPWTNDELKAAGFDFRILYRFERGKADGVLAYEDTLMATSEYGLAQLEKYRATGEAVALASAAWEVAALLRVLFEGEQHERGYLPKPHGGMRRAGWSHEISPDQIIKGVVTLRAFQPWAPPAQRATIDGHLVAIADYFVHRNFVHPYRDRTLVTAPTHSHALSLYVPILVLAAKITGERRYLDHLGQFSPVLDGMLKDGGPVLGPNGVALLGEGFHLAMAEGYKDDRLSQVVRQQWGKNVALLTGDGAGWNPSRDFTGHRCVRLCSAAPLVDRSFPELGAIPLALRLMRQNPEPRRILHVAEGNTLPPGQRFEMKSICETSISSWLLGYWRLRALSGSL